MKKIDVDVPVAAAEFVRVDVFGEYRKGRDERCTVQERQINALEKRQTKSVC